MKQEVFDALEECLKAMERGEPLAVTLGRYPHMANELRPLLESARVVRALNRQPIPPGAVRRSRVRILTTASSTRGLSQARRTSHAKSWRYIVLTLAIVVILILSGNGILIASAQSLPGDFLYPLKLSVESTRLNLASNPLQRQQLQQEFSQQRIDDTKSLITIGRVAQVEFDGVVASRTADGWSVEGIPVVVTNDTHIDGGIKVGDHVRILGETHLDGSVQALSFEYTQPDNAAIPDMGAAAGNTSVPGGARSSGQDSTATSQQTKSSESFFFFFGQDRTPERTGSFQFRPPGGFPTLNPTEFNGGFDRRHRTSTPGGYDSATPQGTATSPDAGTATPQNSSTPGGSITPQPSGTSGDGH